MRSLAPAEKKLNRFRLSNASRAAIPENVQKLTREDHPASYREARQQLSQFQYEGMNDAETQGLIELIVKDDYSEDYVQEVPLQELKNDALECLLARDPMPENLGDIMLTVVEDDTQDPIWREYVLQHFVFYYQQRWPQEMRPLKGNELAECQQFQRSLARCLRKKNNGLAGTALIVLKELTKEDAAFDKGIVITGALQLASDETSSLDSRITALSVLGELDPLQVRRIALDILKDDSNPTTLRLAAMGALKSLASEDLEVRSRMNAIQKSYKKRDQHPLLQRQAAELSEQQ
jgi:hypothetical protein